MKKTLIVLAIGMSASAYADDGLFRWSSGESTLDLYGVLDAAVVNQNHSYGLDDALPNQSYSYVGKTFSTAPSRTDIVNGGLSDSRLGLKGAFDLGGGFKAVFDLESGFDITNLELNNAAKSLADNPSPSAKNVASLTTYADSSLNGQPFARAMWGGFKTPWGTLAYGTQDNPAKELLVAYDPVRSDTFSPFGESGTVGGGLGSSEESRLHHSVEYKGALGAGFDVSLAYQFGDDASTSYGRTYAARVGYQNGPFSAAAAYSNSTNAIVATNGTAYGNIKLNVYDLDGFILGVKYQASQRLHLSAGYEYYERKAPSDPLQQIGLIWGYQVASVTLGSGFKSGASQPFRVYFVGGDYDILPKLNLALGYYGTNAGALSSAENKDYTVGTVSAVLRYRASTMLDVYAAATTNSFGGNVYDKAAAPGYATTISVVGVGARIRF